MNDKELADRLVQAGFKEGGFGYWIPGTSTQCNASLFVRDPRVAMACMNQLLHSIQEQSVIVIGDRKPISVATMDWNDRITDLAENDCLERAICEAYVKAMEGE